MLTYFYWQRMPSWCRTHCSLMSDKTNNLPSVQWALAHRAMGRLKHISLSKGGVYAHDDLYNIYFIYCWLQVIKLQSRQGSYLRSCLLKTINQSSTGCITRPSTAFDKKPGQSSHIRRDNIFWNIFVTRKSCASHFCVLIGYIIWQRTMHLLHF